MNKKFLKVSEISEITGLSESFFYIESYKQHALGEGLPVHRFGPRAIRFDPEEVLALLEMRKNTFRPLKDAVAINKALKTGC
jgi:predicted DNA-binding transcriptional regulator AlpA